MRLSIPISLIALHIGASLAKRMPLDAIFDPIMKGPGDCSKYVELGAAPRSSKKLVNMYWDQIYDLSTEAFKQLDEDYYTKNFETRKLVRAFFGIISGDKMSDSDPELPTHPYYANPWKKVTTWHHRMARYVQTKIDKPEERPFLACDDDFTKFQWPTDPARKPDGSIVKDDKGKTVTLAEFVKQRKVEYTKYWWFLITVNGQTTYYAWERPLEQQKLTSPKATPNPPNPKTGRIDFMCHEFGGATFWKDFDWSRLGDDYKLQSSGILLCPSSFEIEKRQKQYTKKTPTKSWPPLLRHEIDLSAQPRDTDLSLMGTNALVLYHEMWHLIMGIKPDELDDPQGGLITPDPPRVRAVRDSRGRISPSFPRLKKQFVVPGQAEYKHASGPVQCMWVAIYDFASPANEERFGEYYSLKAPECYAWFDLALFLQVNGHEPTDWSSGGSRKPGQQFQDVVIDHTDQKFRFDPFVP